MPRRAWPTSESTPPLAALRPTLTVKNGGVLPTGMTLASDGVVSGTATASGSFTFTVTTTDAHGQIAARAYTVVVAVPTLTLAPATLPAGIAGTVYSQTVSASGGNAPYSHALTGGALPAV